MKIAMICSYDYFRPGGVQAHIRGLRGELKRRGHEVRVLAPRIDDSPREIEEALLVGRGRRFRIAGTQTEIALAWGSEYRALRDLLQREHFDLFHFHCGWNSFVPLQIYYAVPRPRVVTIHTSPNPSLFGKLASSALLPPLIRVFWPRADGVMAVSEAARAYFPKSLRSQVRIVPNGIDTRAVASELAAGSAAAGERKLIVLFLGRLEKRKGVHHLLDAWSQLGGERQRARLVIAGEGPERGDLTRLAAERGLTDVAFTGALSESEKSRYLASCDIFCAPASYGESFGIVLLEAMANGKPVVAAANPGYRDLLRGEGAALLVEPDNPAALARKLRELMDDSELRSRMGAWGLAEAQQYDWKVVTDRVESFYREAMGRRPERTG